MNEDEYEEWGFLRLYSSDLNTVRHTLRMLRRYRRKDVRYAILRDVIVTYARPFSGNKGERRSRHKLTRRYVAKKLRPLHDELLAIRNQLFAHTDFTYYRPKFADWSTPENPWFPMSFRGFDYEGLDKRVEEIEALVEDTEQRIDKKIEKIERRLHREREAEKSTKSAQQANRINERRESLRGKRR